MPLLRLLRGSSHTRQFPIERTEVTLGRDPTCDIHLKSDYVSVAHAKFTFDGENYRVTDLQSRNHTYLNGQRLTPEVAYPLEDSDLIKVCNFIFTFVEHPSDSHSTSDSWSKMPVSTWSVPSPPAEEGDDKDDSSISSLQESSSSKWNAQLVKNPQAKLRAMMQITRNLHDAVSLEGMLDKVLASLFDIFPQADSGTAVVRDSPGGEGLTIARGRAAADSDDSVARHDSNARRDSIAQRPVINNVMTTRHAVIRQSATTSTACSPLLDADDRVFGGIHLSSHAEQRPFTHDDLDLLTHVALQTSFAVESLRLHEAIRRDRERQIELEMAQRIQLGLMPGSTPSIEGYAFDDFYNPAKEVGGDFFDYIQLRDGRLAIVIGDVSGKGVPAALVVASVSSLLKAYLAGDKTALEVVNQVNADYQERVAEERFVTLALLVLDPGTGEVTIVNAGHVPPWLRRADGRVKEIAAQQSGLPLGVVDDFQYREACLTMASGDSLVICTDGITEAGSADDMYGVARLREQIENGAGNAQALRQRIMDDLLGFVGEKPQHDDMCLLCVSRD